MLARNRTVSVLTTVSYVLTITASALFHNHGGNDGHSDGGGGVCRASAGSDCGACPVCQFLAQKPASAEEVPPPTFETMVEEVVASAPARVVGAVFTAWWSRAPPAVA